MEISIKTGAEEVNFESLKVGEFFVLDSKVYLKTNKIDGIFDCVEFETGKLLTMTNVKVTKVKNAVLNVTM